MTDSLHDVQVYEGDGIDRNAWQPDRRIFPGLYAFSTNCDELEIIVGPSECQWEIRIPGPDTMTTLNRFEDAIYEHGGPLFIERLEVDCFRVTYHFTDLSLVQVLWGKNIWVLSGQWMKYGTEVNR